MASSADIELTYGKRFIPTPLDCQHELRRNATNFLLKSVAIEEFLDSTRGRDKLRFHRGERYTVLLSAISMDKEADRWTVAALIDLRSHCCVAKSASVYARLAHIESCTA
jgi:hypothetical protein